MKKYFLAKSATGCGFMFNRSECIAVPTASADKIAAALNRSRYHLKEGQTWYKHENDLYFDGFICSEIRSYKEGGNIKLYKYYG